MSTLKMIFFPLALLLLLACPASARTGSAHLHDILVLHSYHSGLPWTENVNSGIKEILLAKDRQDIELHIEYMDSLRQPDPDNFLRVSRYLNEKYGDRRFDAVIGVDIVAVNFLQRFHAQLFPLTPVLYCGVNCQDEREDQATSSFIGICEKVDVTATIEAGLHLYPATKDVFIINDRTADGLIYDNIISESAEFFAGRLAIHLLENLPMDELLAKVREIKDNSLVLLVNFTSDREGKSFSYERSLGLISAKCKVPILSMWRFYLGNGVLGGMMVDARSQGVAVAKMVVDILMGEPVENFAAQGTTANQLIFDYNQMKRFNIPYKSLPEGSIVTDEPQSILWKYKKIGLTVLGIALALEATIIILSVVTYKSKKAEQMLEVLVEERTHELITANEKLKGEIHVRTKVEEALRDSEETLHQLSVNLLTVQENERRRISLELHDELGQSLAALKLQVGSLEKQLAKGTPEIVQGGCNELRQSINLIIENVRRLSRDLSPVALDDLGIDAALEYLITNFAKLHGIEISLDLIEINHLFSQDAQRLIYRIVQESLNNIGKHAYATHIGIRIEKIKNRIFLIVKDNGTGFNTEEISLRKKSEGGMGLAAMAERVRILEGVMDIESEEGKGTTITVSLPV
ncbi:MAG: sensor histidine kinase [Deltaproteobacteria bacterium]|nr:sensor histidine kinase [Deltaproteobacteria bacterium]